MGVKFEELSSYYKLLFMFGDYGYNISAEMGKELDYLTKLYLVDIESFFASSDYRISTVEIVKL